MKITNKDLIQSYIITTARYDFNTYEKRILYRIVEHMQQYTKGVKLNEKYAINEDLFGDYLLTMDLNSFLNENDNHYDRIKDAFRRLNEKKFEYQDDNSWAIIRIVETPEIMGLDGKYDSIVKFRLNKRVFNAFFDFSKGYRKYELETAMEFESVYAMRFYELFSEKKEPIIYTIEEIKTMFNIANKYKNRPSNFINKVIEPAKKELDKNAPYSFKYEAIKTGRKITHVKFKPFQIPANRDPELEKKDLQKKTSIRWDLSKDIISMLKERFALTDDGIKNNRELLAKAVKSPEFKDICSEINGMIRKYEIKNPAGFYISQLKKKLNE